MLQFSLRERGEIRQKCTSSVKHSLLYSLSLSAFVLQCTQVARAESDKLERGLFLFPPELCARIETEYVHASQEARLKGETMNRGPARHFLERNGIDFPYGASAALERAGLTVVNTAENLERISKLLDTHHPPTPKGNSAAAKKAPKALPFDPKTMDFEQLSHGGVVYTNVAVKRSTPAELEITHASGSASLPLGELEPDVQRRYSYDSTKALAFLEAERKAKEEALRAVVAASTPSPQVENSPAPSKAAENPAATSKQERNAKSGRAEDSRSYERVLCRTGRVFENVSVTADYGGFDLTPQNNPRGKREVLRLHDAPASLLVDFELFDELFRRAVVANGRTQLYQYSGDGAHGGKAFQDIAKNPPAGSSFVSVPEGYLLANMNWISLPMPAVELVIPVGGRSMAVASAASLVGLTPSKWWNEIAGHNTADLSPPGRLERKEPGKNAVLYSPFNPEMPLLGNTTGEMKRAWVDRQSSKHGPLALVETGNGLFFGYYFEHTALDQSDLTWADAIRESSGRFTLSKVSSQTIKPGERFLKLFDASARKVLGAEFKELGQLKLSGKHFRALLQRGVEAAVQDRVLPKGDGVQFPEGGVESSTSPALDIVTVTDQVDAKLKDVLPHAYVFDIESKQRVIEIRKENVGGRTSFKESAPQRRKQNNVAEIPPDLDGGLRLTDGQRIYELKPALGGTELTVWETERNKLKRF